MYLNVHSYYSLRYGVLSPEKLVAMAKSMGIESLALTDINNSAAMLDFMRLCRKNGLHGVAGMEFRNGDQLIFTALAQNTEGFMEINELRTRCNLGSLEVPAVAPLMENTCIIYPFGTRKIFQLRDNEFIGVPPAVLNRLSVLPWKRYAGKFVAFSPVVFASNDEYHLHKLLRAIDHNTVLSRVTDQQMASPQHRFFSPGAMQAAYENFPRLLQNAEKILGQCSFDMDLSSPKNRKTFTGSASDDNVLLRKLAYEGLEYRYGQRNSKAAQRLEYELELIIRLGFAAYFLITWDIIRYSLCCGIYHVGRGSGANSLVAYCLRITDVDPIELDLYFERFINPKRSSPPDFDIDYSWRDRDKVQQYIFARYGPRHAALLGAMSTFQGKSILRELGKVFGLPKPEIDAFIENPRNENLHNDITRTMLKYGRMMHDFPNLRSIHAGGVLITDMPVTCYSALDLPPKGFPTTQFDMYTAEDAGFEKFDILSQRGIGHIHDCVAIVRQNRGIEIDAHDVPRFKNDEKTRRQLVSGETIGCFYIESPAMRGLLKKLRCSDYITLVAASSIIRPGVAQSGMMREYIWRFHHPGEFSYIHPVMEQQLKETYGVMVYQEDVLKVCHHFAGLDLADADVLRRVMSGKPRFRNEFELIVNRYFENCRLRGYPEEITREVWRQIESFAGYSFSKAHSASYAAESFQSLYLKAHYPLEFMVAVINNFGGFYRSWVYFAEAKRQGANILLPCVNHSEVPTCIMGKDIYIGFTHVQNLENKLAVTIAEERRKHGFYHSLSDFIDRTAVTLEQLIILIRCGALRFTQLTKPELLWQAHRYLDRSKPAVKPARLFDEPVRHYKLPQFSPQPVEDAYDEIEFIGFPVSLSWPDLLQTSFRGDIMATAMLKNTGKNVRMLGVLVNIKYVWTKNKEVMHFASFLDAEGNFFDTVHFPKSLQQYPFTGHGVYLLKGTLSEEFGYPGLTVEKMAKMPLKPDPRFFENPANVKGMINTHFNS